MAHSSALICLVTEVNDAVDSPKQLAPRTYDFLPEGARDILSAADCLTQDNRGSLY